MRSPVEPSSRLTFGLYQVNLQTGELWKAGFRIKLQSQPFKVLAALIERPGEVVTREELQLLIWGKNTTVDFDHSLGTAINKIREALGDSADNPRFIETLAKRGYRFIAPVTGLADEPAVVSEAKTSGPGGRIPDPAESRAGFGVPIPGGLAEVRASSGADRVSGVAAGLRPIDLKSARLKTFAWAGVGCLVLGAICAAGGWTFARRWTTAPPPRMDQLTHAGRISPGSPNSEDFARFASDGVRIFTAELEKGRSWLDAVSISNGDVERLNIPGEIVSPSISDLSRDGSRLLLRSHASPESEQPVWIVPTTGGSAMRVGGILAHAAIWMPDQESVLFASGNDLSIIRLRDGSVTHEISLPGRAFEMHWSPDGSLLRFTLLDPIGHTSALWELDSRSRQAHPLLEGWNSPAAECCGVWSSDGKQFIFQSTQAGTTDLWRISSGGLGGLLGGVFPAFARPVKVTNGPLSFGSPVVAAHDRRIFFLGLDSHAEVQRFSADRAGFVPETGVLADASREEYSRNGRWVAWTDPQGRLWRARASDGSERLELTPEYLQVFLARWSPDSSKLVLMAREAGKAWQLYLISAEGGTPERLVEEKRNQADPTWAADGRSIAFGRTPDLLGKESATHAIEVLDLATRKIVSLPGSDGLFSPRWSPDGKWIAALTLDQRKVMLFDVAGRSWKLLADTSAADPVWGANSQSIYVHASQAEMQPIVRIDVPTGRMTVIANLATLPSSERTDYFFVGLGPNDLPLIRARTATANLYSLDLGLQ